MTKKEETQDKSLGDIKRQQSGYFMNTIGQYFPKIAKIEFKSIFKTLYMAPW